MQEVMSLLIHKGSSWYAYITEFKISTRTVATEKSGRSGSWAVCPGAELVHTPRLAYSVWYLVLISHIVPINVSMYMFVSIASYHPGGRMMVNYLRMPVSGSNSCPILRKIVEKTCFNCIKC